MTYFVTRPILNAGFALSFTRSWLKGWNQHGINVVLSHYADDFELSSSLIPSIAGESSSVLRGKADMRVYWKKGLAQIPNLHFELKEVLTGVDSIPIYYQGHRAW